MMKAKAYRSALALALVVSIWGQTADAGFDEVRSETHNRRSLLHVLAIGISDYEASSILNLPGSVADVQAVAAILKKGAAALYDAVEVVELVNQQASRAAVLQAVDHAAARLKAEDTFVFYFSGHALSEGETYLLPQDAALSGQGSPILATLLSAADLRTALGGVQASHRLLIFDSMYFNIDIGIEGTHVLQATGPEGSAMNDERGGVFTTVLLQALQGWADADQDGKVSVFDLAGFVGRHLPVFSSSRQFPFIRLYGPDFSLLGKPQGDSGPATVGLADKLDANLVGLIRVYEAEGIEGVQAYGAARQIEVTDGRVQVVINAISSGSLDALKDQVTALGGSVQTEFENILYAMLPVGALEGFVMQAAVWRVDGTHQAAAPSAK